MSIAQESCRTTNERNKDLHRKDVAGSALSQLENRRTAKLASKAGQSIRTEVLREARTARVKAALAVASSMNALFRSK